MLTHGTALFGSAIDSGRVLILLMYAAMTPLLYHIARKLGCSVPAATLAGLVFALSPLALFYGRLLLLDSMMLFWTLLSLDLLLDGWGRLSRVVLSGLCFGVAVLTKETAIALLPVLLVIAIEQRHSHQGRFAVGAWLLPALVVMSWYPLYALLKGELIPSGGALLGVGDSTRLLGFSGGSQHVSLVSALLWQGSRSGGGMFNLNNQFWQLLRGDWLPRDAVLIVGGAAATGVNLLRGRRNRRALLAGLLGLLPIVYLGRGGVVLNYYILFALPFLCLNLGLLAGWLLERLPLRPASGLTAIVAVALVAGYIHGGALLPLFDQHPADAPRQAVAWIKQNLPADSRIIARDDMWVDLHNAGLGGPAFPNVHSHWKVAADPAIRDGVFHNDWHTVDYLIMSHNLQTDFTASDDQVAIQALAHAHLVKRWESPQGTQSLHPWQIVELWKVDKPSSTDGDLMQASNAYIDAHFEHGGAYANPDGTVTSESQAYALLRDAWSDDKPAFEQTWAWTQAQLLNGEGLLAWRWQNGAVADAHTATDADTDTALALLMAGRRWSDQSLIDAGTSMVAALWQHDVAVVNGTPYLTAGDWAAAGDVIAINPSYFSPYAYHVFAEVDPNDNWQGLIDAGYTTLFNAASATLGKSRSDGLPPDWVGLDRTSGQLVPLQIDNGDGTQYGFDAARTFWRVALDLAWTGDGRASAFLQQAGFLDDEVTRKGAPSAVYARDGSIVQQQPSLVGDAGALAALQTIDPAQAGALYSSQIVAGAQRSADRVFWANPDDLYAQEWGWFAVASYGGALPDLWHNP